LTAGFACTTVSPNLSMGGDWKPCNSVELLWQSGGTATDESVELSGFFESVSFSSFVFIMTRPVTEALTGLGLVGWLVSPWSFSTTVAARCEPGESLVMDSFDSINESLTGGVLGDATAAFDCTAVSVVPAGATTTSGYVYVVSLSPSVCILVTLVPRVSTDSVRKAWCVSP
jgi:hypothetical protein